MPPPASPEEGYHLSVDLTDKAIEFIQDAKAIAPDKPFFLYFCPGAAHAPHHVPKEWADKYKGTFDMGYEAYREGVFARQKALGLVPESAELSPINPYVDTTSHDGKPWSQNDRVRPWDSLTADEKRLFSRMAEVYAGFLSHADDQLGRLLDYLEESGQLENTIVVLVSDNGASGEGGPNGSVNENKFFNGIPDTIEENLKQLDELGATGHLQPLPDRLGLGLQHAVQALEAVRQLRGRDRRPAHRRLAEGDQGRGRIGASTPTPSTSSRPSTSASGSSCRTSSTGTPRRRSTGSASRATFDDADAVTGKETQFYSMLGTRAIWHKGWKAATAVPAAPGVVGRLPPPALGAVRHRDRPERVPRPLGRAPRQAPGADRPVVGRGRGEPGPAARIARRPGDPRERSGRSCPARGRATSTTPAAPRSRSRSRRTSATGRTRSPPRSRSSRPRPAGVLFSQGSRFGGHALYVKEGHLRYVYNFVGERVQVVESEATIPTGHVVLSATFDRQSQGMPTTGTLTLHIRDQAAGSATIMTQPGKFGLGGGGLVVGRSGAEPVTDDYPGTRPWPLIGGTITKVVIDVSGEPFVDLAKEAAAMFARQ